MVDSKRPDRSKSPRKPVQTDDVLNVEQEDGYYKRIVNDKPGRIEKFLKAGYTIVNENVSNVDGTDPSQLGSVGRMVVNQGVSAGCRHGVVMKLPLELYHQDQLEKQKRNDAVEASYDPHKTKQPGSDYGHMSITGMKKT